MSSPPKTMICPITAEIMTDPVIDKFGHSYERFAIENWIKSHHASPLTKEDLELTDLKPNRALKDLISMFKANPNFSPSVPEEASGLPDETDLELPDSPQLIAEYQLIPGTEGASSLVVSLSSDHVAKPGTKSRHGKHICLVIDTSGSMCSSAAITRADGHSEGGEYSILDITKHAALTIIHSLSEHDTLTVVEFNTHGYMVLDPTLMTDDGKQVARLSVLALSHTGMTALWSGIEEGLKAVKGHSATDSVLIVLTDGEPTMRPARGELSMLQRFLAKEFVPGDKPVPVIQTFGFGYSLDSVLLRELACAGGNGSFSFIPDASLVGTIFINSLASTLATSHPAVRLEISGPGAHAGVTQQSSSISENTLAVMPGPLAFGQPRQFVVEFPGEVDVSELTFMLHARATDQNQLHVVPFNTTVFPDSTVLDARVRQDVSQTLRTAMETLRVSASDLKAAQSIVQELVERLKAIPSPSPYLLGLIQDITGQVVEAFSRADWYKKWGCHYVPSLAAAHLSQRRINFKDPGLQFYGGSYFEELQEHIEDVFGSQPPPPPSRFSGRRSGRRSGGSSSPAPTSMRSFYDSSNVCVHGSSTVLLANGTSKCAREMVRGDLVRTHDGVASVECVVKTTTTSIDLVRVGGLLISPYHPVRINGEWVFPITIGEVEKASGPIYNFVLNTGHSVVVDGVEVITLGHEFTAGVSNHPYFGSSAIVDDLKRLSGWDEGFVVLPANCFNRIASTHQISGMKQHLMQ